MRTVGEHWQEAFASAVRRRDVAEPLKEAALAERLRDWTTLLTAVVVESCRSIGWAAAAKGHALDELPQAGQEYLGLDVMAFDRAGVGRRESSERSTWLFPVAVFELENSRADDRVAYSLWKTLCARTSLRVVFAYRPDWDAGIELVQHLGRDVVGAMNIDTRIALGGDTLVVLGSRGEGDTFPHGYFKTWRLSTNTGRFDKL
jgi:hypothetical protein